MANGSSGLCLTAAAAPGLILVTLMTTGMAEAGGLRCSVGEAVVENLKVGHTYSLQQLANLPLTVTNTGDQAVRVVVDVLVPDSSELRQGAEPIPDRSWASADPDSFTLAPGSSRGVNLHLHIPDNEKLLGRKFEAIFWSHTLATPGDMLAYGLKSRIIFSLDRERGAPGETPRGDLSIAFLPARLSLDRLTLGRKCRLEESSREPLTVRNTSSHKVTVQLEALRVKESGGSLASGSAELLESGALELMPSSLTLEPGEQRTITGSLNVPKKGKRKGQHLECVIAATVLDQPVRTRIFSWIDAPAH